MEQNYPSELSYWLAILVKMRRLHVIWMRKKNNDNGLIINVKLERINGHS